MQDTFLQQFLLKPEEASKQVKFEKSPAAYLTYLGQAITNVQTAMKRHDAHGWTPSEMHQLYKLEQLLQVGYPYVISMLLVSHVTCV